MNKCVPHTNKIARMEYINKGAYMKYMNKIAFLNKVVHMNQYGKRRACEWMRCAYE